MKVARMNSTRKEKYGKTVCLKTEHVTRSRHPVTLQAPTSLLALVMESSTNKFPQRDVYCYQTLPTSNASPTLRHRVSLQV